MKLRRIVHGAAVVLALVATCSHGQRAAASGASASSDGSAGAASPPSTTPVAPIGEETTKLLTPQPTVATPEPTATTPNFSRTVPTTPPPTQNAEEKDAVTPTPAPVPVPSPSEETPRPTVPEPGPTISTPGPTANDIDRVGETTLEPTPVPTTSDPTPTPTPTATEPESPPPPVAMVPPGLVHSPPTTAVETPSPETSPVPDAGSPSPPRGPQPHTTAPTSDQENRETSTSPDTTHSPTSSMETSATTSSPVATVEVTVKDTSAVEETTPRPKSYRRGDNVMLVQKQLEDGTKVDVKVVVSPAEAPAMLVRSASTTSSGSNSDASTDGSGAFSQLLQTAMAILAFTSLLVLMVFHFVTLQPTWTSSMSVLARPNQWELLVFITYIQAMGSTAHYVMRYAPGSLWDFVDAFSWTVFIPFHRSSSGVSTSSTNRRLTDIVVLEGIVAFADRIGVNEIDLLQTSAAGLVISSGVVAVLVGVVVSMMKHYSQHGPKDTHEMSTINALPGVTSLFHRNASHMPPMYIVYGAIVAFGVFALYPVSLLATFEIASQVRVDEVSGRSLAIALLLLLGVPMLLVVRSMIALALIHSEDAYKTDWRPRAVWGILSSSECIKYDQRVYVAIAWLAMQLASAIIVGGVISDTIQLPLLLAVHIAFGCAFFKIHPFAPGHRLGAIFTYAIGLIKAINTALALGFVHESTGYSSKAAAAFIAINALVITLWFVRIATIAARVLQNVRNPQPLVREHASLSVDEACESTLFVALPSVRDNYQGPRQAML